MPASPLKVDDQAFAEQAIAPSEWIINANPGANAQATCNRPAVANQRHVITSFLAVLAAAAVAPGAATVTVSITDGTITYGPFAMSIAAVAGQMQAIGMSGLALEFGVNATVTFAFSGAAGANTIETLAAAGYTKNAGNLP